MSEHERIKGAEPHELRDGLLIHDSFHMETSEAWRWFNAPRGWQRDQLGFVCNKLRIGSSSRDEAVLAIDSDVHHVVLDRVQAGRLATVLMRYYQTGEVSMRQELTAGWNDWHCARCHHHNLGAYAGQWGCDSCGSHMHGEYWSSRHANKDCIA